MRKSSSPAASAGADAEVDVPDSSERDEVILAEPRWAGSMTRLWPRPVNPGSPVGAAQLLLERLRKCLLRCTVAAGKVLHLVLDPDVLLPAPLAVAGVVDNLKGREVDRRGTRLGVVRAVEAFINHTVAVDDVPLQYRVHHRRGAHRALEVGRNLVGTGEGPVVVIEIGCVIGE